MKPKQHKYRCKKPNYQGHNATALQAQETIKNREIRRMKKYIQHSAPTDASPQAQISAK